MLNVIEQERPARARDARGRFVKLARVVSSNDTPELPPGPLSPAGALRTEDTSNLRHDLDALAITAEIDANVRWANEARRLHSTRQLRQAVDHGLALLDALDLGPLALDMIDGAIAALDALDEDPDLEDEPDDEATGDDELSLGWREAVSQLDLGHGQDDGEPTLGAPERSPYVASMGSAHHKPANGSYWRARNWHSQASWAQGSRLDGEGEACVGYDIGDDSTPDEDGFSRPWLDAERVFGLCVEGDCCAPHILDGGVVHIDQKAEPVAGDFVAIFFEGWRDNRYGMHGWVKRLSMSLPSGTRWPFYSAPGNELRPVLMVESLNPPTRFMLDVTKVHAVFKVVNVLPPARAIAAPGYMDARR